MFYWKQKTTSGTTLEDELLTCKAVSQVFIASAFLSREGIRILQQLKNTHSLQKENIILYLSDQFSTDKPHEILNQLSGLCVTKILFDHKFHPKVYYLQGKPDKIIYGSSNFTEGGMAGNIEFDFIGSPSPEDIQSVTAFFEYCDRRAKTLGPEIIQYYKDNQVEIADLHRVQKKLTSVMTSFTHHDDAFSPDDYDLNGFYFCYKDYEIFFERNRKKTDSDIQTQRRQVQNKMLAIHQLIYPSIKKLGIAHHKRPENITSLIIPHPINFGSVGWLGVRYGKTPPEVDVLNAGREKEDDTYGFQKHGCLQFSIGSDGFDVNLFLAVRHGAIDRSYIHEKLMEKKLAIESELAKLKGQCMAWVIWDNDTNDPITFDIDSKDPSDFYDFFKENDQDGRESYLQKYYAPNDAMLQTKERIGAEVLQVVKNLLPLYNTMVWRPPV